MLYDLQNVSVRRHKGDAAFELNIKTLQVSCGEFSFVVGESGCGKSTLLDTLGLLIRPNVSGRYCFQPPGNEKAGDVGRLPGRQLIALRRLYIANILQSGGLISTISVQENILLSAGIAGVKVKPEWRSEVIERLGLGDCLRRKPSELSGGQRQRVAIARAVLHRPAVILADEPTAAVDQSRAHEICEIFRGLTKISGCAVIMVTHNHELAQKFADRTLMLGSPNRTGAVTTTEINWH
jgi:putative ABC transport system ATP-binding protein